jgi:hypothetical protein
LQREAGPFYKARDLLETLRVAGHHDQQYVRGAQPAKGFEQRAFLAFPGARGDENLALRPEAVTETGAEGQHRGRWCDVELDVACDHQVAGAQFGHAAAVAFGLGADGAQAGEGVAGQAADAPVAPGRALRQAGIDHGQRGIAVPAAFDQVWPQFGFHQDADARMEVAQETPDCPRHVVGQVDALHPRGELAEEFCCSGPAGGRHVGQQQAVVRVGFQQGMQQRGAGAGFAYGYGMQPDHRPGHAGPVASDPFTQVLQVFGLAACAPGQAQQDQRGGQIPDGGVKRSKDQGDRGCSRGLEV